jgi:hypothetical protein
VESTEVSSFAGSVGAGEPWQVLSRAEEHGGKEGVRSSKGF